MSVAEPAETLVAGPPGSARSGLAGSRQLGGWRLGRFLASEMGLVFGRRRNRAGLAVLAVVPIIIAVSVRLSSDESAGGPTFVNAITGNGLFVALAALTVELPLFLPLAMAAVCGDAVAGEANLGTLRYLLTIPAGRTRLLVVKYLSLIVSAVFATALVAVVGALIGVALFGTGPMMTSSGLQISFGAAVWRLVLVVGYIAAILAALGAIGLFVSTLTEQPIGAMIAVVLVNVMMYVLDTISQLSWLHPWLLTHWATAFGDLLRTPIYTPDVTRGLLTALGYAVVFWFLAWARFSNKDVSS
jgi:ABC-2 type transport system permease protein